MYWHVHNKAEIISLMAGKFAEAASLERVGGKKKVTGAAEADVEKKAVEKAKE